MIISVPSSSAMGARPVTRRGFDARMRLALLKSLRLNGLMPAMVQWMPTRKRWRHL